MTQQQRFFPAATIADQRKRGQQFFDMPVRGDGWLGIGNAALQGIGSVLYGGMANAAERSNQDLRASTMAQALNAPDTPSMAKLLMGSGIPGMDEQGLSLTVQERRTAADRAYQKERDAAQFEQQKQLAQFNNAAALDRARAMLPLELDKARQVAELEFELKRKQQQQMLESLGLAPPQAQQPAAAAAPPVAPADPSYPTPDPIAGAEMPTAPEAAAPAPAAAAPLNDRQQRARQAIALGQPGKAVEILTSDPAKKANEAYDAQAGKALAETESSIREKAIAARDTLGTLDMLQQLVASDALAQGPGTQTGMALRRLAGAVGIETATLSNAQVFEAITGKLALANRSEMPGAMSDADRQFLVAMVPNLSNTKEGNLMLIEYQRRLARRNIEVARLAERYKANNGGRLDSRFDQLLQQWSDQNPLFSEQERIAAGNMNQGGLAPGWGVQVIEPTPGAP